MIGHMAKLLELRQRIEVRDRSIRRDHGVAPTGVLDQLAAAVHELGDVRARRGGHRRDELLDVVVDAREVDVRRVTPLRGVPIYPIYVVADENAVAAVVREVGIEESLRAELGARVALLSRDLVVRAGVHRLDGGELLRSERVVALGAQRVDVEVAGARVGDLAVDQAVDRIALFEHALRNRRALRGAYCGRLSEHRGQDLAGPYQPEKDIRVKLRRRTGDDAVEELRIVLRHHHRLPAAVGAALEVRMRDRLVVERLAKRLRRGRYVVMRAQAPVLHLLRMTERPARVLAAVMAHVAAGRDEAVADVLRQARVGRGAGIAAGAVLLEAPAPRRRRGGQPDFELDLRILRWPRGPLRPAER